MEHNKIKKMIQLFVYDELEHEKIVVLEAHLKVCAECRLELEEAQRLTSLINKNKPKDVSDTLLYEARRELKAALRVEKNKTSFMEEFLKNVRGSFVGSYKLVYTGAASLVIGLIFGYFLFNTPPHVVVDNSLSSESNFRLGSDVKINNVNFIDNDASDGEVEFTFDAVKPVRMKGKIDDQTVQNILAYSMLNEENPGTRLNSINLISGAPKGNIDKEVKDALVTVAQHDQNPGVRREALLMLQQLPFDDEIKHVLLYALKNDENSALRIVAINCLSAAVKSGYKLKQSELDLFENKVARDENSYVRLQAKTVLQEIK